MSDNSSACPIWGTPANITEKYRIEKYQRVPCIDSPRAGGEYVLEGGTLLLIKLEAQTLDDATKAHLTSWLIDQRRLGEESPLITLKTIEDAQQRRDLPVYERADRFLRYLSGRAPFVGGGFGMNESDLPSAQAWLESKMTVTAVPKRCTDERDFFLDYLKTKGWLNVHKNAVGSRYTRYNLTVEGHAHLEELERGATDSSQAFVAMWFDDSLTHVWREGIKLGIEDAGYKPLRIDRKEYTNKIDDEIIAEIRRSRFIVADFTQGKDGARGGVYYEAGFAHGLGIQVIFTCRKDVFEKVHFDTRQYNHIVWETPEELRSRLVDRIAAVVGDGPLRAK